MRQSVPVKKKHKKKTSDVRCVEHIGKKLDTHILFLYLSKIPLKNMAKKTYLSLYAHSLNQNTSNKNRDLLLGQFKQNVSPECFRFACMNLYSNFVFKIYISYYGKCNTYRKSILADGSGWALRIRISR